MVHALVSLALAATLLPLAASAVPIRATDGKHEAVLQTPAGPRRPGLIPVPAATTGPLTDGQMLNQRGRPVPGVSANRNTMEATTESQRAKVAETTPGASTREL
ncbi:MAG: hypothetical protein VKP63_01045 [Cyanobacteriota bacterium]|nr:hypothetical protein [Cyanobacteriota bacterium]